MWLYVPPMFLSPASTCAPGTAGSSSGCDSPAWTCEPWLTLSGKATQRPSSWRGWRTRPWISRLSGLTSRRSRLTTGAARWRWSLPDSPVNRSATQDSDVVYKTNAGSGPGSRTSFATWDAGTSSWRTSRNWSAKGSPTSSVILPRSGSMRNGVCWAHEMPARHTNATGSGSSAATSMWGTPTARDEQRSPEAAIRKKQSFGRTQVTALTTQVKMWPTPRASEGFRGTDPPHGTGGPSLRQSVGHHHQTTTTDGDGGSTRVDLNPRFVESLMGLPDGWSDAMRSNLTGFISWATAWSLRWPLSPYTYSPDAWELLSA